LHYGCDPQTSGGLLVAVKPESIQAFKKSASLMGLELQSFGKLVAKSDDSEVMVHFKD